jgi:hypothetical protein
LLVAGTRAVALSQVGSAELDAMKRRFLNHCMADGRGGQHGTGPRWWIIFRVYGQGLTPLPEPRECSYDQLLAEELALEDYAVWLATTRPSGRQVSHVSILKYVSSTRSWYRRFARRELGVGHAASIIGSILKGYARTVDQPPAHERVGCTPQDVAAGLELAGASLAWRALASFGMVAMARGCEMALDTARGEVFEESEHMTASDVAFFSRDGVRHARVAMRKRKDLRVLRGKQAVVVIAGGGVGHFDAAGDLDRWIVHRRAVGIPDGAPLFCDDAGVSFTVAQVRQFVKDIMRLAGRDPSRYGAHSLRIGGATAALAAGVPPALIRLMGRWASDVYEIYCRLSMQSALGVGTAISAAMVSSPEDGFQEESFEMQPCEVAEMRERAMGAAAEGEEEAL